MARASQDNQQIINLDSSDTHLSSSNLRYRRIVIKAGTGPLTNDVAWDSETRTDLARQLVQIRDLHGMITS